MYVSMAYCSLRNEMERNEMEQNEMISRMEYRSMYFPPEVDCLHSWANFQADRLCKSNDTYQYKCGGVKAYKKGRGLGSGCGPSLKNAWA